jgi:hypothetical protein
LLAAVLRGLELSRDKRLCIRATAHRIISSAVEVLQRAHKPNDRHHHQFKVPLRSQATDAKIAATWEVSEKLASGQIQKSSFALGCVFKQILQIIFDDDSLWISRSQY